MSALPWIRLVTFGPAGFAAYARVRFIPDPTHQGQRETEADSSASSGEVEQWRALLQLLVTETPDPSDCYFGLWEGWGFPESARRWPTFGVPRGAHIAARAFFRFVGRSRKLRSGVRPRRLGSGAGRNSPGAARPRACGRQTTRGASQQMSTHTGPG